MQIHWPCVVGLWTDQAVIVGLFKDMGRPAGNAADSEGGSEEVGRQTDRVEQDGGIELNVGVEASAWLQLFQQRNGQFFDTAGQDKFLGIGDTGHLTQFFGTWVFRLIHTMSKAHQTLPMYDGVPKPGFSILNGPNLVEHI